MIGTLTVLSYSLKQHLNKKKLPVKGLILYWIMHQDILDKEELRIKTANRYIEALYLQKGGGGNTNLLHSLV